MRVVVIDDDHWKRSAMAAELDAHPSIGVVHVIDQDEAVAWPISRWEEIDVAVVDVFDENAPSEVGTDVFSGIAALDRLKELPVRTLAITPHCQHPLIQMRIFESRADALYHRWEVNDLGRLVDAILNPDDDHAPARPASPVLAAYGARRAATNSAVRVYERSPLFGLLRSDVGLKSLHLPRRTTDHFRTDIADTGFDGTEDLSYAGRRHLAPRWPDVRDFVLTLLGRRSVPPTELDREDGGAPHH
jgi:hypothetical protein